MAASAAAQAGVTIGTSDSWQVMNFRVGRRTVAMRWVVVEVAELGRMFRVLEGRVKERESYWDWERAGVNVVVHGWMWIALMVSTVV